MSTLRDGRCCLCGDKALVLHTFNHTSLALWDQIKYKNECEECLEDDINRAREIYKEQGKGMAS